MRPVKTLIKKMNLRPCKRYRFYLDPFNLSNVGNFLQLNSTCRYNLSGINRDRSTQGARVPSWEIFFAISLTSREMIAIKKSSFVKQCFNYCEVTFM